MDNSLTQSNQPSFDAIRQMDNNGREYWSARDLHDTLGYSTWQKFQKAINRAMKSYKNAGGINVDDHFNQSVKMVSLGSGAERKVEDFHLSRRACYLIAMNADPDMPSVALAQAYFYTKTRESELKVSPEKGKEAPAFRHGEELPPRCNGDVGKTSGGRLASLSFPLPGLLTTFLNNDILGT